jgi:glycosyltransferase involved in cell wall biosynthesis
MPAHNEAENLPKVVAAAWKHFESLRLPYTIIVVDDGSTDGTAQVLVELSQRYGVQVVTHAVNAGYGAALRSGIQRAFECGHGYIAFCDSDDQFNPADIDLLIEAIDSNPSAGAAIGYREERADGMKRRAAGRGWHHWSSLRLNFQALDVDCGFKLFRRETIAAIDPGKLMGDYAVISPEILARIKMHGFDYVEVPMPHYPRSHGEQSGVQIQVALRSFIGLERVRRSIREEARGLTKPHLFEIAPKDLAV